MPNNHPLDSTAQSVCAQDRPLRSTSGVLHVPHIPVARYIRHAQSPKMPPCTSHSSVWKSFQILQVLCECLRILRTRELGNASGDRACRYWLQKRASLSVKIARKLCSSGRLRRKYPLFGGCPIALSALLCQIDKIYNLSTSLVLVAKLLRLAAPCSDHPSPASVQASHPWPASLASAYYSTSYPWSSRGFTPDSLSAVIHFRSPYPWHLDGTLLRLQSWLPTAASKPVTNTAVPLQKRSRGEHSRKVSSISTHPQPPRSTIARRAEQATHPALATNPRAQPAAGAGYP